MRPAQALLCWAVTGIVLSTLWAGATAAAHEQLAAIARGFDPAVARAAASQPARSTLGVSSAFEWSSMMRYFASAFPWTLWHYTFASVLSLVGTLVVVSHKLRRGQGHGRSSTALPPGVKTGVAKATAVSTSPLLWAAVVSAPLISGPLFVSDPVLITKLGSLPFLLFPTLSFAVLALGFLWTLVFSVLCGLRIARHLRRIRCVSCGYDLKGTLGDRCSECGMDLEIVSDA